MLENMISSLGMRLILEKYFEAILNHKFNKLKKFMQVFFIIQFIYLTFL